MILSLICLLFSFPAFGADSCLGKTAFEYRPKNECETEARECCSDGYYSEWGKECRSDSCPDDKCWNGSFCESRPSEKCVCENGTCNRTYTCEKDKGWVYNDGDCICNSGYKKNNGVCRWPYIVEEREEMDSFTLYTYYIEGNPRQSKIVQKQIAECESKLAENKKTLMSQGNYGALSAVDCPKSESSWVFSSDKCDLLRYVEIDKKSAQITVYYPKIRYTCNKAFAWI